MLAAPITPLYVSNLRKGKNQDRICSFRQGLDYIITHTSSVHSLVKEILGFSSTRYEAFTLLSNESNFFSPLLCSFLHPETLTPSRRITYFLIVCYLRSMERSSLVGISVINQRDVNNWVISVLEDSGGTRTIPIYLNPSYVNEVHIKNENIYFKSLYNEPFSLHINKLRKTTRFIYTTKIEQSEIELFFHNTPDENGRGYCLGLVKLYLQTIADSASHGITPSERRQHRLHWVKSLELNADGRFIDLNTWTSIQLYNKSNRYWKLNSSLIASIYSNVTNLPSDIQNLVVQLLSYRAVPRSSAYFLITTSEHALGLTVKIDGFGLKFTIYDPNDELAYVKKFVYESELNFEVYLKICRRFDYLANKAGGTPLLIRVYTLPEEYDGDQQILVQPLPLPANIAQLRQLFLLAMENDDVNLIEQILQQNSNFDPNFDQGGITPLNIATARQQKEIIQILINHGARRV